MYYYSNNDCIACRRCAEVCPVGAPAFDGDKFSIDPEKCIGCGTCAAVCTGKAIFPSDYIEPPKPQRSSNIRSVDCDVLVIGSGPAGLTAAARQREQGRSVIVLEAAKLPGGAGVHATGYTTFDTKWQKDAGAPEYLDDYVRGAMTATRNQLDYSFIRNAFKANSQFFDWFCTFGEAEKCFFLADSPVGKQVQMDFANPAGRFMMEKLIDYCEKLGVEIMLETAAKQFLKDGDKVVGVLADHPTGPMAISFRACLVATGNMCESPDLEDFLPEYAHAEKIRTAHRMPTARGDGVRMVREAGIPVDYAGVQSHYLGAMPLWFDGHVLKQGLRPEGLRVNQKGQRFISEGVDRFDAVDILLKQPGCVSYNIVDSNLLNLDIQPTIKPKPGSALSLSSAIPIPGEPVQVVNFMGIPVTMGGDGKPIKTPMDGPEEQRGMGNYPPGSKPDPERLREYAKTLKNNHVCAADTLEELAEQMEVPGDTLKATVARYNELCHKGCDEDYGKYPQYMIPLEQGPYYAFKCFLGTDGVFGGIFVDQGCRIVKNDAPVCGLYAAGDLTSGNYIKENSHRTEVINDFTWALASGFLAASSMDADFEAERI